MEAVVALGSNLEDPIKQVKKAIQEISDIEKTSVVSASSLYITKPVGPQDQPFFINAVAVIETALSSENLLNKLQEVEQAHRRVRKQHWGPRTLDLDILFYGNEFINTRRLIVPHPEFKNRVFTIIPLLELKPDYQMPDGTSVKTLVSFLPQEDLKLMKKIIS